jgi:hypothetical protein
MPPSFPSHQGLIAPLWRRWPHLFDIPALFIGAAMPDVVDGVIGVNRGHFGQALGHSLIALPLLCIPGGLLLWWLAHRLATRTPFWPHPNWLARAWNHGLKAVRSSNPNLWKGKLFLSLALGSFSHLIFDLFAHGGFAWFYPWWTPHRMFPSWWYTAWIRLPVPGYREPYPVGPHFVVWVFLGLLGIYLLFYPFWRDKNLGYVEHGAVQSNSSDQS